MSIIPSLPVTLQNGTTADATQVMADFNSIVTSVNNNAANNGVNSNITSLTGLTTPLSVSQGGTGQSILTPNAVLLGESTSGINAVAPGPISSVLVSNGPGVDPSFGCPYGLGDLYLTTNAANPSIRYVGTTWVPYAAGQVLIGVGSFTDGNGTNKAVTAGQQFGEYQHTLVTNEMPSHTHTDSGHSHGGPSGQPYLIATDTFGHLNYATGGGTTTSATNTTATANANIQNTGGGGAHNNIQPSIGVYIWQRTA